MITPVRAKQAASAANTHGHRAGCASNGPTAGDSPAEFTEPMVRATQRPASVSHSDAVDRFGSSWGHSRCKTAASLGHPVVDDVGARRDIHGRCQREQQEPGATARTTDPTTRPIRRGPNQLEDEQKRKPKNARGNP